MTENKGHIIEKAATQRSGEPFQSAFQVEGSALPKHQRTAFLAFYAERLRFRFGARSRARDVLAAYQAWAEARRAPSLSFWDLRKMLGALGHTHLHSNGIQYRDLVILALADRVGFGSEDEEMRELLAKLDQLRIAAASLNEAASRISRRVDVIAR